MGIFGFIHRAKKIQKNLGYSEKFTVAEIVNAIINLWDAKKQLDSEEYFYVSVLYEIYSRMKTVMQLDYLGYLGVCNEIIAHFDLVAPYYKYCGNNKLVNAYFIDDQKLPYRKVAKKLLEEKKIFKEEWMSLHEEFMEEFYS